VARAFNWNFIGYFTGVRTDSNFVNPGQFINPGYARLRHGRKTTT